MYGYLIRMGEVIPTDFLLQVINMVMMSKCVCLLVKKAVEYSGILPVSL